MDRRPRLHELLESLLGSSNVYYQPPATITMQFPCIVYSLSDIQPLHSNNEPYLLNNRYLVTVIHRRPDNDIYKKVAKLPQCSLSRAFVADNLNHYAFDLYY